MTEETVEQVEPTTEPAAEPVAAPEETAPEPTTVYDADWLNEPVADVPPAPQPAPQPPPQYPPQPPQQYPQQPRNDPDSYLNDFVRDPRGSMQDIARQEAAAIAQQALYQGLNPVQQRMDAYLDGQVRVQTNEADNAIRGMYRDKFSKDEAFAGDERVRGEVKTALSGLRQQAEYQARMGDPTGLMMFQQPGFADVTLAAVKAALGVHGGAMAPASVPHVETTSPSATPEVAVDLDPDTVEALRSRFGDAYVEKYRNAVAKGDEW